MRMIDIDEEFEQLRFAEKAAKCFATDDKWFSYSDGEIVPGCLLALRGGVLDDCVIVLKLDRDHTPTNYARLVRKFKQKEI